jgi:integrase/recombinase XerD
MEGSLKHLLPHYGEQRISLLSSFVHEQYKTKRLNEPYLPGKQWQKPESDTPEESLKRRPMTKNSINRELNCLLALLAYAEKEKIAIGAKPELFPGKQSASKSIVPLSPGEVVALNKVLTGPQSLPIRLMMFNGLRLKESTLLKKEEVHLNNNTLYVTGKGGDPQAVGILKPVMPYLKAAIDKTEKGFLSVNPKSKTAFGNIQKSLNAFLRRAGIDRSISHHALRHSCATAMILAGYSVPFVQSYLRHADVKTTMIYVKIASKFEDTIEQATARKLFMRDEADKVSENNAAEITEIFKLSKSPVYADSQTRAHHS